MKQYSSITILLSAFMLLTNSIFAQDNLPKYGDDSIKCIQSISLFREFAKQKNYKDAVKPWRYVFNNCPKSTKHIYVDGVKIMKTLMKEDKENKDKYVDTIMMIYDQRIKYFGQEGYVCGRKGSECFKYRRNDLKGACEMLKKSFELQGNKSEAGVLALYYQVLYGMYKKELVTKEEVLEQYSPIMDAVDYNIKNAKKDRTKEMYEKAKNNVNELFSQLAECPDLIKLFQPKFDKNPQDTALLIKITKLLDKRNCTGEQLFFEAAVALNQLKPSAESAYNLGKMSISKNKCNDAIKYFKQAAELATDDELKTKAYLAIAKCYIKIGQPASGRTYAQKALGVNPNLGEAYIVIGDAYAYSAKECGDNDCAKKAAYWVAIDKYAKAKAIDSAVVETANQKIATYSKYFPKKSDCFFYSINEGDSYTVGCWINETTKVRVVE